MASKKVTAGAIATALLSGVIGASIFQHPPCPDLEMEINNGTEGQNNVLRPLIVTPNPNCERAHNVILSAENDTKLQNNIGIIFVDKAVPTTQATNVDYCDLALFTWNGHTYSDRDLIQKSVDEADRLGLDGSAMLFPRECYNEIPNAEVPEFGLLSMMVLIIAVSSIIIIGNYKVMKW